MRIVKPKTNIAKRIVSHKNFEKIYNDVITRALGANPEVGKRELLERLQYEIAQGKVKPHKWAIIKRIPELATTIAKEKWDG